MEKSYRVWRLPAERQEYTSDWEPSQLQSSVHREQNKGLYGCNKKGKAVGLKIEGERAALKVTSHSNIKGKIVLDEEIKGAK